MIRSYVILIGLLLTTSLKAQLLERFSINFETNAYLLTHAHHQIIDSVIQTLPNIPEGYNIEIKGHTDNKGLLDQNNILSKKRANSVLIYLKSKNFVSTDTSVKFYAYNDPLAPNTEDNLWKNRRVEVNLYARSIDMVKVLGINDFKPKRYKLNEDIGGTVSHDSTRIVIVANSFLHQNGTEVTGEIDLTYIEYRSPSDFLLSGIPMSIKTGDQLSPFNSGGMFDIAVYQNGEQLILKKEKEKTLYILFPLNNVVEQDFYKFDPNAGIWNTNPTSITNAHGNLLAPFNGGGQGPVNEDKTRENLFYCAPTGDTCSYIVSMINKLKYYLNHEEPIRFTYPYKFVKNNIVDFESPLYAINIDKATNTLTFVSKNKHNKLDVFTNYIWKYKPKDMERSLKYDFAKGASFVKIANRNGIKFKLVIENEAFSVTGEPIDFRDENIYKKPLFSFLYGGKDKAFESKLKKLNRKNFKRYLNYTRELDLKENELEKELKISDDRYTGIKGNDYCKDSLDCMEYFYKKYLYTEDEKVLLNIYDFNVNKEKLAAKINGLPSPFTCKDVNRLLIRKDSIANLQRAKRTQELNNTQNTFAEFGINSTGIYNADQIKGIKNPIEIFASYKTETDQPLKIISVYVSIKGLNGIINYNGYANYGPYKFVYGKKDETMLVAVDDNEKSYYCTTEEFAAFVSAKQSKTVNFILKPLRNLESVDNLQKIVSR